MKNIAIFLIRVYQLFLQPMLRSTLITVFGYYSPCKHSPTCSEYAVLQIRKHGTITGLKKGLIRILSCR